MWKTDVGGSSLGGGYKFIDERKDTSLFDIYAYISIMFTFLVDV